MNNEVYISDFDVKRFKWLISNSSKFNRESVKFVPALEYLLKNSTVLEPKNISNDIVTMHSKILVKDLQTGEENIFTLVFPFDEDINQSKLSILSEIGIAAIGRKQGNESEVKINSESKKIKIEKIIYQPESEGFYYI